MTHVTSTSDRLLDPQSDTMMTIVENRFGAILADIQTIPDQPGLIRYWSTLGGYALCKDRPIKSLLPAYRRALNGWTPEEVWAWLDE